MSEPRMKYYLPKKIRLHFQTVEVYLAHPFSTMAISPRSHNLPPTMVGLRKVDRLCSSSLYHTSICRTQRARSLVNEFSESLATLFKPRISPAFTAKGGKRGGDAESVC